MTLTRFFNLFRPARRYYAAGRAAEAAGHGAEALKHYERAAAAGSGPAHYRLGEIHRDGLLGQPVNWKRAADAFMDAAISREREAEAAGSEAFHELTEGGLFFAQLITAEETADHGEDSPATAADGEPLVNMEALRALLADWHGRGWLDRLPAPQPGSNLAARRAQLARAAMFGDGAAGWEALRLALDGRWGPAEDRWLQLQLSLALLSDVPPPPVLALASLLLPATEASGWREMLKEQAATDGEAALWCQRLAI